MLKQRNINRKQKIQAQSASEMTIDQPHQHIRSECRDTSGNFPALTRAKVDRT